MNTIKVYKKDGTLKYHFVPTESSEDNVDGFILSQNCYLSSDDTGAEMEGGSCDFVVTSENILSFDKTDKIKYYTGNTLFCTFYVDSFSRDSEKTYSVTGIDSISRLEDFSYFGTFLSDVSLDKYFKDNLSSELDIDYSIEDSIKNLTLTASYPSGYNDSNNQTSYDNGNTQPEQNSSKRELLQKMALGLGIRFDTLNSNGIDIKSDLIDYKISKIYKNTDIYSDISVTEKQLDIGIINIYLQSLVKDNTKTYHLKGYFPINNGEETRIDPFTKSPALDIDYYANGTTQQAVNEFTNNFLPKDKGDLNPYITLYENIRTSEYFSYIQNTDGSFTYKIDTDKLEEVKSRLNSYVQVPANVIYTDEETGIEYALGNIGWRQTFLQDGILPYLVTLKNSYILDKNKPRNDVLLPFYSDKTDDRVKVYFGRTKQVEFKVKYSGERLGDIISIPYLWGEKHYAAIKSMDFSFSAVNVFCNITADILSDEEKLKVITPSKYGIAEYGKNKYGEI